MISYINSIQMTRKNEKIVINNILNRVNVIFLRSVL